MDFTIEQRVGGTPSRVQALLLDPEFIAARADLPKLGGSELLDCTRDGDRARVRVRMHFTGELAPAVTAVVDPDKLTWVDDATVDLAGLTATHTIVPDHYADRLSCSYEDMLRGEGDGTRRVLRGRVKVRMLLVGPKVEGAIVSGLREYAAAEAALMDAWLRRG